MALTKQYDPEKMEPELEAWWQESGIYRFREDSDEPVHAVDTPPPTVSGKLHLGHMYSYSHADFIARYRRMRGDNVYYPIGFDDNGLPTERLVEKTIGRQARAMEPSKFIDECLRVSLEVEEEYSDLLHRLALSIDWRYQYRTIDPVSQRCSQHSFIDLFHKGLAYRSKAPAIWCPECGASFAQADLEDRLRPGEFITLPFLLEDGKALPIATTRPELLRSCAAVFVHPSDRRYTRLVGKHVQVPLYEQRVPILADISADPEKGTGAVMCCTFGDQADVAWQRIHHLPVIEVIDAAGKLTEEANIPGASSAWNLAGLSITEARTKMKGILADRGMLIDRTPMEQSVRVHERCETPVEYRVVDQWFIKVLDHKQTFLDLSEQLKWYPEHMKARYRSWVENLSWDWSISRQRAFGVPIPAWYCKACGETMIAEEDELPVDPRTTHPTQACRCGSHDFIAERDRMDTWATSSVSPMIASGWLQDKTKFAKLFPMTQRPLAHEIIRTWVFYSIVKSWYHFKCLPWSEVLISGWAVAGEGMAKISKSKGGGPMAPMEMIRKYSADGLRYWAASTSAGRDAVISEEKIRMGMKLATKLWNVARFAEPFLSETVESDHRNRFTPADLWIRARCAKMVNQVCNALDKREYASAKAEIEGYFWRELADNYLEMVKQRLYQPGGPDPAASSSLKAVLRVLVKLLAPFLPYVTEAIWRELFAKEECESVHISKWPDPEQLTGIPELTGLNQIAGARRWTVDEADEFGNHLVSIASAVRRYKSEHALSLASSFAVLALEGKDQELAKKLASSREDLLGITRARELGIFEELPNEAVILEIGIPGFAAGLIM